MSNIFLISVVVAIVFVAAFLIVRDGRVTSARCPRCLRLGQTSHYGHCRCPACGAVFWLSEAGHSVHPFLVWQILVGPLVALLFGSAFVAVVCYQSKRILYALIPALAVLSIAAAFKLYRVLRTKDLVTHDHAA